MSKRKLSQKAKDEFEFELREEVRKIALELVLMQQRLFDKGLVCTAHALNKASGELGWEAADFYEKKLKEREE